MIALDPSHFVKFILLIFLILPFFHTVHASSDSFTPSTCQVEVNKLTYSLEAIGDKTYSGRSSSGDINFRMSICKNLPQSRGCDECNIVIDLTKTEGIAYGSVTRTPTPSVIRSKGKEKFALSFTNGKSTTTCFDSKKKTWVHPEVQVKLICSHVSDSTTDPVLTQVEDCVHTIDIKTPYVCKVLKDDQIATGTIILLYIFGSIFLYLFIGILWNRFFFKKQGFFLQSIPNITFWSAVLQYFVLGLKFVKCKVTGAKFSERYNSQFFSMQSGEDSPVTLETDSYGGV